jgi:hypothetical protein
MDELDEINRATREILRAVHAVTDAMFSQENARAMVLGIAAEMIVENMKYSDEVGAAEINAIWKGRGFGWRMDRVQ